MATKYVATTCTFELREVSRNDGEGELISCWDESDCLKPADTIEGVLEQVHYLNCDVVGKKSINEVFENDPCQDKKYSRFDAELMVDVDSENIIKPTEEKYKQFERDEVKLYALHIIVYIDKQSDLEQCDIAESSFCK